MYRHYFTVEGSGQFPIDMLRYDACFPRHEDDSYEILRSNGWREVTLVHYSPDKEWEPTFGRWNSFTWRVKV